MVALVFLGIAAIAAGSWWIWRRPPAGAPERTLDPTRPESLYAQAIRLGKEGRNLESLRFFERAGPGLAGRHYEYHFDYAAALHNLCVQAEERRGIRMPVVRTSVERVALMRQALAEMERAERVAPTPPDKSRVLRTRALILRFWGLPWNAFEQLRLAQYADRSQAELAGDADAYMRLMQNPMPAPP